MDFLQSFSSPSCSCSWYSFLGVGEDLMQLVKLQRRRQLAQLPRFCKVKRKGHPVHILSVTNLLCSHPSGSTQKLK
jgi:hypothetical protein